MEQKVLLLARTAYKARLIIRHYDPNAIVLWKLPVHMGLADELSHIDPHRKHFARGKTNTCSYCPGSIFRGEMYLVQAALSANYTRKQTINVKH